MEHLSAQHDWSTVILIVHERWANLLTLLERAGAQLKELGFGHAVLIRDPSHSFHEADCKICNLFE